MKDKIWKDISTDAKNLIKLMLTFDPTHRISAREALRHKWFENAPDVAINIDLMKESLGNLLSFNAIQKMQQATMSMMVQNMITKDEINRLQQVF